MMAAIEVYNKPRFSYRDEVVAILLVNAWELLLKATLSKARERIYYPKEPGQAYRSLSLATAVRRVSERRLWAAGLDAKGAEGNLELLTEYRDAAVHLYNAPGFEVIIYGLAQTSIISFKDHLLGVFGHDLGDEITWHLLPLGIRPPFSALAYLKGGRTKDTPTAVEAFLRRLAEVTERVADAGGDTGRVMTVFDVSLQSVKKVEAADVVVGVSGEDVEKFIVQRPVDPNKTHPLTAKEVVAKVDAKVNRRFTQHTLTALLWHYKMRGDSRYMWQNTKGTVVQWSHLTVEHLARLTNAEVDEALKAYREHLRASRRKAQAVP